MMHQSFIACCILAFCMDVQRAPGYIFISGESVLYNLYQRIKMP